VREAPVKFLALLLSRVEYYYRLKQGLAVGQSLDALSQAEGKKTYPVQKDLQKMRGLTLERLSQLKHLLLKTERALKSGTQQPVLALEQLFLG
jgi:DNA polymerase III delta subunit